MLISETFLKMYNTIFRRLHSFILSNENTEWTKRTHHQVPFVDEELTDFQVRKLSKKLTQLRIIISLFPNSDGRLYCKMSGPRLPSICP